MYALWWVLTPFCCFGQGYDISLLITNVHMETHIKSKIVDFVCDFISNVYADIMEMKLALNARGRKVAELFLVGHA